MYKIHKIVICCISFSNYHHFIYNIACRQLISLLAEHVYHMLYRFLEKYTRDARAVKLRNLIYTYIVLFREIMYPNINIVGSIYYCQKNNLKEETELLQICMILMVMVYGFSYTFANVTCYTFLLFSVFLIYYFFSDLIQT